MNLNQINLLPALLLSFVVFLAIIMIFERKFFSFVKTYWFYNRSIFSYISSFFFILGIGGLLFSLLDPRGPEEKIKTQMPEDKTIILIDTSASMLAEDIKPSRLQKAALIAKHFARKAAGHQISIVAFSEIQKKIVPFTADLDLIDARLDSIKSLRNHYGSSALSIAIQESIQYFRETDNEARGNILILTDGEETSESIDLKVPEDIHIALVGIGTTNGGRIPLEDGRGFRYGYKKERGKDVITKLNEAFFNRVVSELPSAKYWPANSYSLPSEEILEFFNGEKIKSKEQQDMVVKPVLMEWIVLPSLLFLLISYIFKFFRPFTLLFLITLLPLHAQESEPKYTPEIISKLDELQKGNLNQIERVKLADDLFKAGAKEEALTLYKENIPKSFDKNIPPEAYMNYGTALLKSGDQKGGLSLYQNLMSSLDESANSKKIKETIDKNVTSFFFQKEEAKKNNKNKDQKKNEKSDNQKSDQSESSQENGQSGKSNDQKNQKNNSNQDMKEKNQSKDNKDQEKDSEEKDKENKDEANKSQETPKRLPPQKVPAKLKQLMADDRQLQMKMIENGTRDLNKKKSKKSKDW